MLGRNLSSVATAPLHLPAAPSLSTEKGQVSFGASVGIMTFFTTLVAGDLLQRPGSSVPTVVILRLHDSNDLGCPLLLCLCWLRQWWLLCGSHWQFKPRVHEFTGRALWTESYQVIHTNDSPSVPMSAQGTVFAEASVIPGTVFDLRLRVNVQEWTFLITAFPKFGVEVTLRHLGHVILVQELALVSLFAQSS